MNIIDIIIFAILALSLVSGMYKGFLASGLTIVGFIAAFVGALFYYPQLSAAIQSNGQLMNTLHFYLDADAFFASGSVADKVVSAVSQTELAQTAASLNLPAVITGAFRENVQAVAFSALNLDTLGEYLSQTICGMGVNVLSFLVMFIVSYVVVLLVVNLLNHVFRFPLLRHMDWLLGGVFGILRGVVVVALICSLVPLAVSMFPLDVSVQLLDESGAYAFFAKMDFLNMLTRLAQSAL